MTTADSNQVTPPEQRMADRFRREERTPRPWTPPAAPLTAEQRLARTYSADPAKPVGRRGDDADDRASDVSKAPAASAEDRLARTYQDPDLDAPNEAADQHSSEQPGEETERAAPEPEGERLAAPEGFQPLDDETASGLSSIATELNLPEGAMQQLVDKVSPMLQQRTERALRKLMDTWTSETTNDPEVGGANLDSSVKLARSALDRFGSPALRKLIGPPSGGGTGLGNHREMLRFLAKVGRAIGGGA